MTQCVKGIVYIGPTGVQVYSERFKQAGINVLVEGTQHLLVSITAKSFPEAEDKLYNQLNQKHGYRFACNMRMKPFNKK